MRAQPPGRFPGRDLLESAGRESVTNLILEQREACPVGTHWDFTGKKGGRVAAADTRLGFQSEVGPGNAAARMTQKPLVTIAPAQGPRGEADIWGVNRLPRQRQMARLNAEDTGVFIRPTAALPAWIG